MRRAQEPVGSFRACARPAIDPGERVAGFWLWQVRSPEEAVEWIRRCPNPMAADSDIEIRPLYEAADFS